jgi:ArsR family transcriptional regulator
MYTPDMAVPLNSLPDVFKALGDKTRLDIVLEVAKHKSKEACVCDLTDIAGLSQGTVSHHLRILVENGLLAREQRGKWAYYSLTEISKDLIQRLGINSKNKTSNCL